MTRELLTGNTAAAWGARLAEVDYVPAYPITPQTEIIESLAEWIGRGELAARMVTLDSEHSMLTAAGAAAAPAAVSMECSESIVTMRAASSPRAIHCASDSMISVCGVIGYAGT